MNNEILSGTVKKIINLTPKGFCVFELELDDEFKNNYPISIYPKKGDKHIKIKGFIGKDVELLEGYKIKFEGNFEERDEAYVSPQFKDYSPLLELKLAWGKDIELVGGLETLSGLRAYLVRYIPGIGEKQADELLKTIPLDKIIGLLDSEKAIKELLKVRGIGQLKAETIKEAWDIGKTERNVLIDLGRLGLSINKCSLVYKTWGENYKDILDEDPYRLTEIRGIGFTLADEVAVKALNIGEKDNRRYAGIVEYIIRKYAEDNGDTIISIEAIKEGIKDFISNEPIFGNEDIDIIANEGVKKALDKNSLFQVNEKIFALGYYAYIETQIARQIQNGINANKKGNPKLDIFYRKLENEGIMTKEQIQAVKYAFTKSFSIILGGAGTGKTFTVGEIIKGLKQTNEDYYIVTPTNKAKARVKEVNPDAEVATIHALLGIVPGEEPMYNKENPLPYKYLIIDETSMLDNKIANILLNAINFENTTIIFVGDPRQLPPVGAGSFYYDLIESGIATENVTYLSEVKRASDEKYKGLIEQGYNIQIIKEGIHNIVANALNILDGKMPINTKFDCLSYLSDFSNKTKYLEKTKKYTTFTNIQNQIDHLKNEGLDVNGMSTGEIDTIYKIEQLILGLKNKNVDINKDLQIYIPTYKGGLGIVKVNKFISDLVNHNQLIKLDRGQEFKLEDKVMYSETDKELGLTKGDIGVIKSIDPINNKIVINFYLQGEIELSGGKLDNIELGNAISVHKAQGTEVKYGVLVLTWASGMLLSNQLLYTAYTRGKEKVFLYGDESAYKMALKTHINSRNTLLFHLLANTPMPEVYTNVSRKNWGISLNELKQIKSTISDTYGLDNEEFKLIKINFENTKNQYSYYRYLFGRKDTLSELELFDGKFISDELVSKIEQTNIKFLRVKKYNKKDEIRGIKNKVIKAKNTLFVEINSYDKDISIS